MDDTDSPRGGCTTYVLTELLDLAREQELDLIGPPRLVRLNPNVPWKTRGNAALSATFGHGDGTRRRIGELRGRAVWSHGTGSSPSEAEVRRFRLAAWDRVLRSSRTEDEGTDPALVVTTSPLPDELYWKAVREVVDVDDVRRRLRQADAWWRTAGSDRGLVGAAAAVAWPAGRGTWELTAYRAPERWGEPRRVDARSVRRVARRLPSLFLCHDPRTRRLLVAPHTACPILYGLRGRRVSELLSARSGVVSEAVDRWVVFRTNQGTGDHLARRSIAALPPFGSGRLRARVQTPPVGLAGGHARVTLIDDELTPIEALAFEPTKTLPPVVRSLRVGDRVEIWGGRSQDPALRLEGIRLVALVPRWGRSRAPTCPACHRRARSLGTGRGYRCAACRRRWPPEAARRSRERPSFPPGVYHPTPSARRHLAPLGPEV